MRTLTPETSYGYAVIHFAAVVLCRPLDPWQQWVVIHAGELLPDGRPRFRKVLIMVARQNGKTHLCAVLALYWLFVARIGLVLGTSTKLDYAAESWRASVHMAQEIPALASRIPRRGGVLEGKGSQQLLTTERCRYKIGTADRKGGRSLPVERLIMDELREQTTWHAYNAAVYAMSAQPHGQAIMITNQGDATAVVLRQIRADALAWMEEGTGDSRLGLFEWSAEPTDDPLDPATWAKANPQLGRRIDYDTLQSEAITSLAPGADPDKLTGFLTEQLCIDVPNLNPAIRPADWEACLDPGDLAAARSRLAACVDLSPDGRHATLGVAAILDDGRVRIEAVASWSGAGCVAQLERELPDWVARVRPQVFGWMPNGPAAAVAATIADRRKAGVRAGWPPPGVTVAEIRSEIPALCMGFGEQVIARQIAHGGQDLLNEQVKHAARQQRGPVWLFERSATGDEAAHVDALYAVAGAAHLARTLPTAVGRPRIISPRR